jgi:hypothetical protein
VEGGRRRASAAEGIGPSREVTMQGRKTQLSGLGSSWMARWSYYGPWLELKGTRAVDPRRRRSAPSGGKAAARLGLRGGALGMRGGPRDGAGK